MQILIILIAIIVIFGLLNAWFGFEFYRLYKLQDRDPIQHLRPEIPKSRTSHPLAGSIFKVYASLKPSSTTPDVFELHVMADLSEAKRFFNYISDVATANQHVIINGDIFKVAYIGSDVKDACTDFVKGRCEILDSAMIVTNVYNLTYLASITSSTSAPANINSDIIEYHLWCTQLD